MPAAVEAVQVDRAWLGAPAGTLGNPTLWLLVAALALLALGSAGRLVWDWPVWATIAMNAVAIYLGFTPLHEAMHGVAHESKWVNAAIGRLAGIPLTIPLPLFRAVHYEHHSHTNDAGRDPDFIVAHEPRALLPFWLVGIAVTYRTAFYGRRLWRSTGQLVEALVVDVAIGATTVAAIVGGWIAPLAVVWLVPAFVAVVFLAFAFDFLPHYPYDTDARYFDTRIYPSVILNGVLLGQNYHLIHHLWTTIPWFRYRRVFAGIERALAERGCRIGWWVTPLPDGVPTGAMPRG
jgi:beta-carotene hydroxylase